MIRWIKDDIAGRTIKLGGSIVLGDGITLTEDGSGRVMLEATPGGSGSGLLHGTGSPETVVSTFLGNLYIQEDAAPLDSPLWERFTPLPTATTIATLNTHGTTTTNVAGSVFDTVGGGTWVKHNAYAAGGQIGSRWTTGIAAVPFTSLYNAVSGFSGYYVSGLTTTSDYATHVQWLCDNDYENQTVTIGVRVDGSLNTGYFAEIDVNDGWVLLYKFINGAYTQLGDAWTVQQGNPIQFETQGELELRVWGSNLYVLLNGGLILTATDSSITATGYPFVGFYGDGVKSLGGGSYEYSYYVNQMSVATVTGPTDVNGWRKVTSGYAVDSIAIGEGAVPGAGSVAIGTGAYALTDADEVFGPSVSIGYGALSQGFGSVAIGSGSVAGNFSIAIGEEAGAHWNESVALGTGSDTARFGIAVGAYAVAGDNCISIGAGTTTFSDDDTQASLAIGHRSYNTTSKQAVIAPGIGFNYAEYVFGEAARLNNLQYYPSPNPLRTAVAALDFRGARIGSPGSTQSVWTNIPAGDWTFSGQLGTGSGTVGKIIFKIGGTQAGSTTVHSLNTRLTIDSSGIDVTGTLRVNGTPVTGGGASALDDLTDVAITSAAANQVIQYTGSAWVNRYLTLPITTVTTTYTVVDADYVVRGDTASGGFTVTLPTASGRVGREYVIKNVGANTLTIAAASGQTIDGSSSITLSDQYSSRTLIAVSSTAWEIA